MSRRRNEWTVPTVPSSSERYKTTKRRPRSGRKTREGGGDTSYAEILADRWLADPEVGFSRASPRLNHQENDFNDDGKTRRAHMELWCRWCRQRMPTRALIVMVFVTFGCFGLTRNLGGGRRRLPIRFPGQQSQQEIAATKSLPLGKGKEHRRTSIAHPQKAIPDDESTATQRKKGSFQNLHLRLSRSMEVADDATDEVGDLHGDGKYSSKELGMPPLYGLSNFKDTGDKFLKTDVPIFWHVPKAGGSTIKDVAGSCHRLVMASNVGVSGGHANDTELEIVHPGGSAFVNIDTNSVEGIEHAKDIGFAESGLANIIVSTLVRETNDLLSPNHMGRFFAVFRHPIERAISLFYYLQVADWEKTYQPELANWTIEEYAVSDRVENNWMTRRLSGNMVDELDESDLAIATETLRKKFFVGLTTKMEESMDRFERFFRWTYHIAPINQEKCRNKFFLEEGGANRNEKKAVDRPREGSKAWDLLAEKNKFDLVLHDVVKELWDEQEQLLGPSYPQGYRQIKQTCCKCNPPTYPPGGFECPK